MTSFDKRVCEMLGRVVVFGAAHPQLFAAGRPRNVGRLEERTPHRTQCRPEAFRSGCANGS